MPDSFYSDYFIVKIDIYHKEDFVWDLQYSVDAAKSREHQIHSAERGVWRTDSNILQAAVVEYYIRGGGNTAQLVKCLLCIHKGLSLSPGTHVNM